MSQGRKEHWQLTDEEYCKRTGAAVDRQLATCPPDGYLSLNQLAERFTSRGRAAINSALIKAGTPHVRVGGVKFFEEKAACAELNTPRRRSNRKV